jgi:hypothetical protein
MILLGLDIYVLVQDSVACCTSQGFFVCPVKDLGRFVGARGLKQTILIMDSDTIPPEVPASLNSHHAFFLVLATPPNMPIYARIETKRGMDPLWMYPCTWEETHVVWYVPLFILAV